MLMLLILSSSRVWMTTMDYSRQSSGTLTGSQPVGVVNDVFTGVLKKPIDIYCEWTLENDTVNKQDKPRRLWS